ncbi:hypothetical protein [Marinicrinis lubricantis]|uniref:Cellulose biosynthesis protein BcsQ n=1 Tax=Marinicrinis lubricantis TaxID=2086470 RepID=A0ABW1ITB3_9BACL
MLRLFIVHEDQEYIQLFTRYIAESEKWRSVYRCSIFTREDTFMQAWGECQEDAVLLLSPKMLESLKEREEIQVEDENKVVLMDSGEESKTPKLLQLLKYQSVEIILQQMVDCFGKNGDQPSIHRTVLEADRPLVIGVSSASGAAGKTLFSLQLMKLLQFYHVPGLYVSLEPFSLLRSLYKERCEDQMDKLMYYFRARKEEAGTYLKECIQYENGFSFLTPFPSAGSYYEMTPEDIVLLLNAIKEMRQFAVIVVDTEGGGGKIASEVGEEADELIWLMNDEVSSRLKLSMLFDQYIRRGEERSLIGKSRLLMNRTHSQRMDLPESIKSVCRSAHSLPVVKDWETANTVEALLQPDKSYVQAVQSVITPLLKQYGLMPAGQEVRQAHA